MKILKRDYRIEPGQDGRTVLRVKSPRAAVDPEHLPGAVTLASGWVGEGPRRSLRWTAQADDGSMTIQLPGSHERSYEELCDWLERQGYRRRPWVPGEPIRYHRPGFTAGPAGG